MAEDDSIARLRAGLAEDEASARAALEEWNDDSVRYEREDLPDAVFGHIALHNPARVLREVAAKRAILAEHDAAQDAYTKALDAHARDATPGRARTTRALDRAADVVLALSKVVRHLASAYSSSGGSLSTT